MKNAHANISVTALLSLFLGMDPFASFFGDQFGFNFGGQDQRNEVQKGANIVMDLYASLEEMYTGNFVEVITVDRDVSIIKQD